MSTEAKRCTCGDTACESELCDCDATPCPVNHRAEEAEAERERLWLALCEEVEKCHQAVAERDAANATITRVREGLTAALAAWTPEYEYHRDRFERKGYSHDETAAEVYGHAIKVVTEALAALDTSGGTESTEETGDWLKQVADMSLAAARDKFGPSFGRVLESTEEGSDDER